MKQTIIILVAAVILVGCGAAAGQGKTDFTTTNVAAPLTVTVAMGYIPDVQFAPYLVAQSKGFFAAEGIKPTFNWGLEVDGVRLVGAKQIDFANVSGDQIIQARAQGIPIVYVANWFNSFPIEIISFKDKGILTPQDLVGRRVGLPCLCGASYTAWRALLAKENIDPARINVQNIGFTQVAALTNGVVDAAVVYANNEPVQLKLAGKQIDEIKVWEYAQLVGNGVAANEDTIKNRPDLIKRFVRALWKGIAYTINYPDEALKISIDAIPEAGGANLEKSRAVLQASIALWKSPQPGVSRLADWQAMEQFMRAADFIPQDVDVSQAFSNEFVK